VGQGLGCGQTDVIPVCELQVANLSDPRIFFAAERTLLAWLRSGLTVIGLGFVVARFGLFLRLLAHEQPQPTSSQSEFGLSAALGVLFVLAGAIAILVATIQHKRYLATLSPAELPTAYSTRFAIILATVVGLLGLVLAGYLMVGQA
jgi:putative membrane protein